MWDTELNQMIRYKAAHSGGETAAQTLGWEDHGPVIGNWLYLLF